MRFTFLFVAAFLALSFACKTSQKNTQAEPVVEETANQEPKGEKIENQILGSWVWYKTSCCFRMPKITYGDSLPQPKILTFEKDLVKYYSGETLTDTVSYKIDYNVMRDNRPIILIRDKHPGYIYFKSDTLVIDYGYMDLQTEYYLKKK